MNQKNIKFTQIKAAVFGLAIGDALGVPVEFKSREYLKKNPLKTMMGYGTHNQPAGTWSDDSSLAFCLLESLCSEYNPADIAHKFVQWRYNNLWTPHGRVFDIGITTERAIQKLKKGIEPTLAGGKDEGSNGNGSLMRILPLAFYVFPLPIEQRFQFVKEVSSLTHGHLKAVLCCFFYIEMLIQLINGLEKKKAFLATQKTLNEFIKGQTELEKEAENLKNILHKDISTSKESEIDSSGYCVATLTAALWSFLNSQKYDETVLKAVNLGDDTDTTGAVAGGLAGLYYGYEAIPMDWLICLAKEKEINNLIEKFFDSEFIKK